MFYDLDDPSKFISDAAETLDDDGVFIAQLMCLDSMLRKNDLGNIHEEIGIPNLIQHNHSRSNHSVLRGLHYQTENPQGKLVRCSNGKIFDVAVDIRRSSKYFGRWVGVLLDDVNVAVS